MLSEDERGRVCVVLVRARNPGNIGAAARAMHDFGFSRLRVVNEFPVPFEAAKSAVDASSVMAGAEIHARVAEAVGDCTMVVGTTAVGERDLQHELVALAEAAPKIRTELRRIPVVDDKAVEHGAPEVNETRVAILFGSEKTGLSNDELSHCNWLLTVPMQPYAEVRHASMNLGQAVAVCLYELAREAAEPASQTRDVGRPAAAASLERITALLNDVMEKTEYTRRHAANSSPDSVRRLVLRMGADSVDAPVWMGFLRQVLWKLGGGGKEEADPSSALRDDKHKPD